MNHQIDRQSLQAQIIEKASTDPAFKQALIKNPISTIEQLLGTKLPKFFDIKVVEESADTLYLVIPASQSAELSDSQLDMVAGGKTEGLIEPDWKPLPPPNSGKLINPFQK